ncbi:hypothetical protein AB0G64_31325 [Streptomyces longwoodensis]|uniref:hypothetical protein n=1 Tax=Streptomyces longwoodensis TaxID=68231 RepID=UPI0033E5AEB0
MKGSKDGRSEHPSASSRAVTVGVDGSLAAARRTVLREIEALLTRASESEALELMGALFDARRVMVLGAGRSKLAVDAFAMRLMHLGLTAHVTSDVTCPAIARG